jgi:phosphoenolpyruvate carboxylase
MLSGVNSRKKDRKSCFQRSLPSIIKKSYKHDSKNVLLVSANRTGFVNYFEAQSPIEEVWSLRFNYHSNLHTLIAPAKIS